MHVFLMIAKFTIKSVSTSGLPVKTTFEVRKLRNSVNVQIMFENL